MQYLKISIKAAIAITAFTLCFGTMATGGGLNSSGCHNSKKVGYHCHRAQPVAKPIQSAAPDKSTPQSPTKYDKGG